MNITLPVMQTYEQVRQWTGWSKSTVQRKVKQGCFPCYPSSRNDVKFNANEILYYFQSIRSGNFDQKVAA